MASLSSASFDESAGLDLFGVSFERIGTFFEKSEYFDPSKNEAQFGINTTDGKEIEKLPTWPGVYIFATRAISRSESQIEYVGKGANVETRLSNYAIVRSSGAYYEEKPQVIRIRNELSKAINGPKVDDVSLWLANCASKSPCYTALENRILQDLKKMWNRAENQSNAGHCSWCAIKSMLENNYLNNETSLTTIANKPCSDLGKQLCKPPKVCSRYPAGCHCLDCTFFRIQDAFHKVSVIDCARSRKMRREIDEFIAANNYQAFFGNI